MLTNSIDFSGIKDAVISAYQVASAKVAEWSGHLVVVIKSKTEFVVPYLQDKRIAVVSLIGANLILIELGNLFSLLFTCCLPAKTDRQEFFRDLVSATTGLSIYIPGIMAFAHFGKLPLNNLSIAGISGATFLLRMYMEPKIDDEMGEEVAAPKKAVAG